MGHDVFISHSSKDKIAADAVCAALESNGVRCWIAPRDVALGQDWSEAIIDGIQAARVMVLVFSKNSNESQQVKREVERAVGGGLTVVPLRVEDVPMSKSLQYFLSTSHWMDALTPPLQKHLREFAQKVRAILEVGRKLPAGAVPDLSAVATVRRSPVAPAPRRRSRLRVFLTLTGVLAGIAALAWVYRVEVGRRFADTNRNSVAQTSPSLSNAPESKPAPEVQGPVTSPAQMNKPPEKGTPAPVAVEHTAPAGNPLGGSKETARAGEWVSLFNGKDLSGWFVDGDDSGDIRVKDSVIVVSDSGSQARSYLLRKEKYSNFILRLEFKPEENSGGGVALRGIPGEELPQPPRGLLFFDHPIVKLLDAPSRNEETGTMHWLRDGLFTQPDRHADLAPLGSWNQLELELRGRSLKVTVNKAVIAETTLDAGAMLAGGIVPGLNREKGSLGIQKHHGTISYRNIEIMELPQ